MFTFLYLDPDNFNLKDGDTGNVYASCCDYLMIYCVVQFMWGNISERGVV